MVHIDLIIAMISHCSFLTLLLLTAFSLFLAQIYPAVDEIVLSTILYVCNVLQCCTISKINCAYNAKNVETYNKSEGEWVQFTRPYYVTL